MNVRGGISSLSGSFLRYLGQDTDQTSTASPGVSAVSANVTDQFRMLPNASAAYLGDFATSTGATTFYQAMSVAAIGTATLTDSLSFFRAFAVTATGTPSTAQDASLSALFAYTITGAANVSKQIAKALGITGSATPDRTVKDTIKADIGVTATGNVSGQQDYRTDISFSATIAATVSSAQQFIEASLTSVRHKMVAMFDGVSKWF